MNVRLRLCPMLYHRRESRSVRMLFTTLTRSPPGSSSGLNNSCPMSISIQHGLFWRRLRFLPCLSLRRPSLFFRFGKKLLRHFDNTRQGKPARVMQDAIMAKVLDDFDRHHRLNKDTLQNAKASPTKGLTHLLARIDSNIHARNAFTGDPQDLLTDQTEALLDALCKAFPENTLYNDLAAQLKSRRTEAIAEAMAHLIFWRSVKRLTMWAVGHRRRLSPEDEPSIIVCMRCWAESGN